MEKYSRAYNNCIKLVEYFNNLGKTNITTKELRDYIFKYIGGSYITERRYMPFMIRMGIIKRKEDGTYDLHKGTDSG